MSIDRPSNNQLGGHFFFKTAAIPIEAALEPGPSILLREKREFVLWQPMTRCDFFRRRHEGGACLRHIFVTLHNVIGWHRRDFFRGPGRQRFGIVAGPIGTLAVKIAT